MAGNTTLWFPPALTLGGRFRGGGRVTVSSAASLIAVPAEFLTTQRNAAPSSAAVAGGVV